MDFFKYQGTGNDFVIIDDRAGAFPRHDEGFVARLCHRRFGIGADGLILLQTHPELDFSMVYFNADGREGSLCGNGGRCTVAFAASLGLVPDGACVFWAADGPHEARLEADGTVALRMADVADVESGRDYYLLDTGSPHYVVPVAQLDVIDVRATGQAIRYGERFREVGVNVNFMEEVEDGIRLATYERGVEDETLSCGTGAVAAAITYMLRHPALGEGPVRVSVVTKGGALAVGLRRTPQGGFMEVWLHGPAVRVFSGSYDG